MGYYMLVTLCPERTAATTVLRRRSAAPTADSRTGGSAAPRCSFPSASATRWVRCAAGTAPPCRRATPAERYKGANRPKSGLDRAKRIGLLGKLLEMVENP